MEDDETKRDRFINEILILWRLRDQRHIARFVGFTDNPASLLMAYYPLGSLENILASSPNLDIDSIATVLQGLARALDIIHSSGFAHLNLTVRSV
jgi:serine/threonine protein kinase